MSTKKSIQHAVRRALFASAAAATTITMPAHAAEEAAVQEVVVTGSRIATDPNLITSSPVTQIRAEEIQFRGVTRIEDMVNDLPQITPELTANDSNGSTGTATLDLRGLGSDRTLVLVNGHRMGFGDPFALAPDVNQVPGALIERVEVLTGGASSTYGSDAVAGVVNFVMKQDFEGVQVNYQYSAFQHSNDNSAVQQQITESGFEQAPGSVSDGGTTDINLIMGVNTADGNGNVTAYLGYRDINAIRQSERDFSACALGATNGAVCSGSATSAEGLFTPFDGVNYFTVEGDEFVEGVPYYNFGPLNYFQRPDERYTGGLLGHYEFSEQADVYAEFMFMDDRSLAQIAPSGAFFVTDTISCDNPFLSAQQTGAINAIDNIARDADGAAIPDSTADGVADYPCVPGNGDEVPFYIGRRNVEGGPRISDLRHTSFRSLAGVRGEIGGGWSYDAYANFSRLVYSHTYRNDMSITRIGRALDVVTDPETGQPVCRSVLNDVDPACVPWNIFQEGGASQEAIDYLILPLYSKADLNMDQFVAYVTGDLTEMGLMLPWAVEGVSVVFGGEYRGESFDFEPDQGFTSGDGAGQGGPTAAVSGKVNVNEFFAEARVPLVQNKPGMESLTLDLRYRYSDYNIGVQADTYNIGGEWTPTQGLMFRGGFSRAVRAPNIRELYEPAAQGLWGGNDPCGPSMTMSLDECLNTGLTAAQYGSSALNSPAGQYNGVFQGDPNLDPETSDSITVGVVFTADRWVPGLNFSIDYWNIEVEDAIDANDPEFVIRQCGATADPGYCNLINRGPNGNLWVGTAAVDLTNVNIGSYDLAGFDIAANYYHDIGTLGSLNFSYRGTVLDQFEQQLSPQSPIEDCAGLWGSSCGRPQPDYKHTLATTWGTPWDMRIVAAWRHVGGVDEMSDSEFAYDAGAENYLDLSASYSPNLGWGETTFTLGATNVLDNDPPVNGRFGNVSVYGNGNTIPGTWDALGRYWFVGLVQNF